MKTRFSLIGWHGLATGVVTSGLQGTAITANQTVRVFVLWSP